MHMMANVFMHELDEYSEERDGIIFYIRLGEETGRFERSEYHGVSG
jgi:hypothetical protein